MASSVLRSAALSPPFLASSPFRSPSSRPPIFLPLLAHMETKCTLKQGVDQSSASLRACGCCCRARDSSVQMAASDDPNQDRKLHQKTSRDATSSNLILLSVSPLPLLALAALPGAGTMTELLQPFVELVRSWGLPDWLVHWGHPGNMAVVLFAMGGYGSYLGWQIRLSNDVVIKANAKDLHPKLLAGMFFFFALGATGGITSLLTSGRPILESPHAVTGIAGLTLLTAQTAMTTFFESNPSLRTAHAFLGSGIMLLFLLHAMFGLQLGLSY